MRVLVTSRWYPSHDEPHRARFVADQIEALVAEGVGVVVASWEPAHARGWQAPPEVAIAAAIRTWTATLDGAVLARPSHWGVGVPVVRLPAPLPAGRRDPATMVDAYAAMLVPFGEWLARTWPFDLIHAHPGMPDGLAALRLSRALDVPLVTTEHERTAHVRLADADLAARYRELVGPRRRLIAVSRVQADRLAEVTGLDRSSIDVVPNAVPVAAFPLGPRADREPHELLYVGNRALDKGTDVLIEAVSMARERIADLHLRLIGRAWTEEGDARLMRLASSLGIRDAVSFEGTASRADVAGAMRRAAVFVQPSPWETFGVVAAEALASGLPVISAPNGGVEEILGEDGSLGEIAASAGAADLASAIERTLSRIDELEPERLRATVIDRYASSVVVAAVVDRYQALVGGPGHAAAEPGPVPGASAADRVAGQARPTELPILVALDRTNAERRLAALPADLCERLTVITSPGEAAAEGEPSAARIVVTDVDRVRRLQTRRLRWIRRGPLRRLVDRLLGAPGPRRTAALRVLILDVGSAEATPARGRPEIMAVDVDDAAAVGPLVEAGAVRMRPGGLRALADRWDERRPTPGPAGS